MQYLAGVSESVPFPDAYFNIVCSINSLDHVHNLDETIREIVRVLAPEGLFLLLTDVHSEATFCEPTAFSWDVVEQFLPQLELLESDHREKAFSSMRRNLREAPPFDHNNHENRHGILSAKFQKPGL